MLRGYVLGLCVTLPLACGAQVAPTAAPATAQKPAAAVIEIADIARIDAVLAQHRGHGVLLNFWATWCVPCVEELPELMEVRREFAASEGDVVLVSYDLMIPDITRDDAREKVESFAHKRGLDVPILIYEAPDFEAINEHYQLPGGVPVTLAFDRNGKQVDVQNGMTTKARFTEMMRKAIAR